MSEILVDGEVTADSWRLVHDAGVEQIEERCIIPLALWLAARDSMPAEQEIGVWLDSDEEIEQLADDLPRLSVIALHFPAFSDGRHYSTASILRRRYGYEGEIRAFGDVRRDQVEQMHRCGINALVPREEDTAENLRQGLTLFSYSYQSSVDRPEPLFRTRRS